MIRLFILLAALLSQSTLFYACSGRDVNENDPASLLEDAEADIESDHYLIAVDKLRALKSRFPYSKQAIIAQLKIADVYYLQESYGEAALAYEAFKDLYPKHERVAYAMYRMALAHQNDMPSHVGRDQTSGYSALEAYETFLKRFPTAPEAKDAAKAVRDIREKLAEKEFYVAEFYLKRKAPASARGRLQKIVAEYGDTTFAIKAKALLVKAELTK